MRVLDLILKKRNAGELSEEEIRFLIRGYVDGSIPEYQVSAFLMATYWRGMSEREISILTRTMIDSGEVMDISSLSGHAANLLVDKHSTGGVGDKVSLILAPIVAAAGAQVPMMSGRGLGHTGGTLDKLESIPGFSTALSMEDFVRVIAASGFAMTGQSKAIVPADKKLYALRDVTGTVESIPLITASILSKKIAEGAQHLVFDVKYGLGAFMKTPEEALVLAQSLVRVGKELKRGVSALITNMDAPLGTKVGNFLEIEESISCLSCEGWEASLQSDALTIEGGSADLMEVTLHLAAQMLKVTGLVPNLATGLARSLEVLRNGQALHHFWQNVALQGGRKESCEELVGKRDGLIQKELLAPQTGYIRKLDAYKVGMAAVLLGAGRNIASDVVLPDVGLEVHTKPGDWLEKGEKVLTLYARKRETMNTTFEHLEGVIEMGTTPIERPPMIHISI